MNLRKSLLAISLLWWTGVWFSSGVLHAQISSFPFNENFETFTVCGQAGCGVNCSAAVANGWMQESADDDDWRIDFGGTGSPGTGPAVDHTTNSSAGQYLYTEASNGCTQQTSILLSPYFDFTSQGNPSVEFFYHMYGASTGSVFLEYETPTTSWTTVWSQVGQAQNSDTAPWLELDTTITAIAFTDSVRFRWRGVTGGGFESDMAIDDIRIYNSVPFDVGIVNILAPSEGAYSCDFSASDTLVVVIANFGTSPVANFPINYSINGGTPITQIYSDSLMPGTNDTVAFVQPANLSLPGSYNIVATTALAQDPVFLNDAFTLMVENLVVTSFPFKEDFESFGSCTTFGGPQNCAGSVRNGWRQDANDGNDWRPNTGPSPSGSTGPLGDNTFGSGTYMYVEASTSFNLVNNLISPCLDLASTINPELTFYYHMYGSDMGTLNVDVSTDAGNSWTNLWTLSGEQQSADSLPYIQDTIDLSAYQNAGTILLRWQGIGGNDFNSDIAIDDIMIRNGAGTDIGITEVDFDPVECGLDSVAEVTVTVSNFTSTSQSNFLLNYQLDGGPIVTDTFTAVLGAYADSSFTFSVPANLGIAAFYDLTSWTALVGDTVAGNDSLDWRFVATSVVNTLPYTEDFESQAACATSNGPVLCNMNNDWVQGVNGIDDDTDWRVDADGTPSGDTGPAADHTFGNAIGQYIYTEASGSGSDSRNDLYTVCVEVDTNLSFPVVSFYYHMYGDDMGTLSLEVSADGGYNWDTLFNQAGEVQQSGAAEWLPFEASLAAYSGEVLAFRIVGFTGNNFNSDMAVDDFYVGEQVCLEPAIVVQDIDSTSAVVNIVTANNMAQVIYEYGPLGFTPGTGIQVNPSANPDTITGLSPLTSYEIYAQAICANGDTSSLNGPAQFTTFCVPTALGDSLGNAIPVGILPYVTFNSTACYNNSGQQGSPDAVYSLVTGPCVTGLEISTCSPLTEFDTYLFLLDANGNVIASNDDAPGGSCNFTLNGLNRFSIINAPVSPNTQYFVQVDGFGTTNAGNYELTINAVEDVPSASLGNFVEPLCNGDSTGSLDINVSGGATPYVLAWNTGDSTNSLNGLAAGDYIVQIADSNGCMAEDTFTLGQPDAIMIALDNQVDVDCFGDSSGVLEVSATGGSGTLNYAWNTGGQSNILTGVPAGMYQLAVTDSNGCVVQDSFAVNEPAALTGTLVKNDETAPGAADGSIDLTPTGGVTPYTYLWSNGATSEDLSGLMPGTYCVTITDANNCMQVLCDTIGTIIGVGGAQVTRFDLYPNPSAGNTRVFLELPELANLKLEVLDLAGKVLLERSTEAVQVEEFDLDLSEFADGMYFVRIRFNGLSASQRLVLRK